MSFEINGKTCETDEEGYLQDLTDWNEDVAKYIAGTEDVPMGEKQWQIVNFLRSYYDEYQVAPAIKLLIKEMVKLFGKDKKETNKYLYELFPAGPAKQACKIAGLPKPTGCV